MLIVLYNSPVSFACVQALCITIYQCRLLVCRLFVLQFTSVIYQCHSPIYQCQLPVLVCRLFVLQFTRVSFAFVCRLLRRALAIAGRRDQQVTLRRKKENISLAALCAGVSRQCQEK